MDLMSTAIDVHPPRARRWAKPARKFSRGRYAIRNRAGSVLDRMQAIRLDRSGNAPPLTLDLVIRLLIPGWAQFYLRRPGRGYVFMIGSALAAVIATLFVGTGYGSLALGTLFSFHAASISDAIVAPGSSVRESIANGFMVYILLGVLIYLPGMWLCSRIAVPYSIQRDISPFRENDVLLVRHQSNWKRGDVVIYNRNGGNLELPTIGHGRRYLNLDGVAIDRILAGPGDHIQSTNDVLTVNGVPVADRPINPVRLPSFGVTVPAGDYFIWPSVAAMAGGGDAVIAAANTPADNITGRVFFRSYPWSRAGFIR